MDAVEKKFRAIGFGEFREIYQKTEIREYPNNRAGKNPLVTVRVLSYNHIDFIRQCLDGILNQKVDFDYEVLIGEDESSDGTRDVCIEYAEKYPDRIRLLLNSRENNIPINGKPSGLFNCTYANFSSQSKYMALCESDDIWQDEYSLQKRVDFMESNADYSFCFHNAINHFHSGTELDGHFKNHMVCLNQSTKISFEDVYVMIPTASLLYRNHLIDILIVGQEKIICADLLLRHKLLLHGNGMYLHGIKPSIRIVHESGVFSQLSKISRSEVPIVANEFIYKYLQEKGINASYILIKIQFRKLKNLLYHSVLKKRVNPDMINQSIKIIKLAFIYPSAFLNVLIKRFVFQYKKNN